MMKLFYKLLDFFHIEHHEAGTLRIVEMEDGTFNVQEWNEDDYYGGDWRWREIRNGHFLALEDARNFYQGIIKKRIKAHDSTTIKAVKLQEDAK